MIASMSLFALSDAFIKLSAQSLEIGQIILLSCAGSVLLLVPLALKEKTSLLSRDLFQSAVLLRTTGEILGSLGFVLALSLIPLATASAIMQAQPLAVTMGAAVFLGEKVGLRRWGAVLVGFLGVIVILRPTGGGFDPNTLWLILAILGLSVRDLGTRLLPRRITTVFVSIWAMAGLGVLGGILMIWQGGWQPVSGSTWIWLCGISVAASLAFLSITAALRAGEISAIAPFRYTRIVFALIIAFVVFGERPDGAMWIGTGLIIASGLYTFWRERRLHAARPAVVL